MMEIFDLLQTFNIDVNTLHDIGTASINTFLNAPIDINTLNVTTDAFLETTNEAKEVFYLNNDLNDIKVTIQAR